MLEGIERHRTLEDAIPEGQVVSIAQQVCIPEHGSFDLDDVGGTLNGAAGAEMEHQARFSVANQLEAPAPAMDC